MYDEFFTKVNAINTKIPSTSGLVIKTKYDSDKQGLAQKIELVAWSRRLITSQKITEIENRYQVLLD